MPGLTCFWLVLVALLPEQGLVTMLLVPTLFHPAAFSTFQLPGWSSWGASTAAPKAPLILRRGQGNVVAVR